MNLILGILVGLLVLTILVALHELGHAYAAIKNGVVVEEYGIGFPPAAIKFKKKTDWILPKGTLVSINWLPLGGFVKLQGEHDSDSGKGDYGAASFWGKTQILLAGVAVNWAVAAILFSILAIFGLPKILPNQFMIASDARVTGGEVEITEIVKDMPAEVAGLKTGDVIQRIAGEKISSTEDVARLSKSNTGKTTAFEITRNGRVEVKNVQLRAENKDKKGFAGVGTFKKDEQIHATWSAPIVGVGTTVQLTAETFSGVGKMAGNFFSGLFEKIIPSESAQKSANAKLDEAGKGVAGPISIMGVLFPNATAMGIKMVLFLAAVISLSLAVMNTLPIPALDGGRWLSTFIFRKVLKKPLSAETEEKINLAGFAFVMGLSLLVIISDFFKVF
ncbi:MAG: M50 family metallopeptidase [bacterium]|nr:M50 family metallopeptidase [bacterium]